MAEICHLWQQTICMLLILLLLIDTKAMQASNARQCPPDSRRPPTISSLRMGARWPLSVATHLEAASDHTCRQQQGNMQQKWSSSGKNRGYCNQREHQVVG